ncbi:MAG: class I SAM-dependent methyltransferase, partial [Trichodesmium sp. MAG_R04]|nr:class I SAM-dependent methyltransferase [Trichodesmium sp. MAG_R04]
SIQYLQYPDAIFYEIHRILKPGGIAIISFSNRMFYQKAIAAWRDNSEGGRVKLVKSYFESVKNANGVPGFSQVEVISQKSNVPSFLHTLGLGGGDPFYVVIAHRQRLFEKYERE